VSSIFFGLECACFKFDSVLTCRSVPCFQIEELLQQGKGTGQYAQMLREILRKMSKDDTQLQLKSLEQVLALGHNIAQLDSQERLHEARIAQGHSHAASSHSIGLGSSLNSSSGQQAPGSGKKSKSPSPRKGRPPVHVYDEPFASEDDLYGSGRESSYPAGTGANSSPGSRFRPSGNNGNNSNNNNNGGYSNGSTGASNARVFLSVAQHQQNNNASRGNVISRVAKVPGLTPDPGAKKVKKVSLHPLCHSVSCFYLISVLFYLFAGVWAYCEVTQHLWCPRKTSLFVHPICLFYSSPFINYS